jgi:hypothetical protein
MLKKELIAENERLKRELSMVCCNPSSYEAVLIIKRQQMNYRLEKAIWMGDFEASDIQVRAWNIIEELKEKQ